MLLLWSYSHSWINLLIARGRIQYNVLLYHKKWRAVNTRVRIGQALHKYYEMPVLLCKLNILTGTVDFMEKWHSEAYQVEPSGAASCSSLGYMATPHNNAE